MPHNPTHKKVFVIDTPNIIQNDLIVMKIRSVQLRVACGMCDSSRVEQEDANLYCHSCGALTKY